MNSLIGIILHSIGGFAAGSFYIPMNIVKKWSWETAWFILGMAAWAITPIVVAGLTVPDISDVLFSADSSTRFWTYFWGFMWGIGGLTFGLTMRYLGISLGMTVALGFCTAFGTLIPPIFAGTFIALIHTTGGLITVSGVLLSLVGIGITGRAGFLKEKDLDKEKQQEVIKEFNLTKGLIIAVISGILSASFAFGLMAGKPIAEIAIQHGARDLFKNNAVLVWVLWGGLTTNMIYVLYMMVKNNSAGELVDTDLPLTKNYLWAAAGGVTWYMQFFFYGMGTTFLGKEYEFASWSLHMASIILFSNLWGIYFKEWQGASTKTLSTLYVGLMVIILSFIMIGMGGNIN